MRLASHDKVNREQREWFNCESVISKVERGFAPDRASRILENAADSRESRSWQSRPYSLELAWPRNWCRLRAIIPLHA
jgi:hypothetical protein